MGKDETAENSLSLPEIEAKRRKDYAVLSPSHPLNSTVDAIERLGITAAEDAFCRYYVAGKTKHNAVQSYLLANPENTYGSAATYSTLALKKYEIQARIAELRSIQDDNYQQDTVMGENELMMHLTAIARADMGDFASWGSDPAAHIIELITQAIQGITEESSEFMAKAGEIRGAPASKCLEESDCQNGIEDPEGESIPPVGKRAFQPQGIPMGQTAGDLPKATESGELQESKGSGVTAPAGEAALRDLKTRIVDIVKLAVQQAREHSWHPWHNYVMLRESGQVDGRLVQEIKKGRDGVSVKLHDKMKALELIGRRHGVWKDQPGGPGLDGLSVSQLAELEQNLSREIKFIEGFAEGKGIVLGE